MTKKTVFGLIGTGGFAQNQHLPNLSRSANVELRTICDLNEDLLTRMQKKYNAPTEAKSHHDGSVVIPGIFRI